MFSIYIFKLWSHDIYFSFKADSRLNVHRCLFLHGRRRKGWPTYASDKTQGVVLHYLCFHNSWNDVQWQPPPPSSSCSSSRFHKAIWEASCVTHDASYCDTKHLVHKYYMPVNLFIGWIIRLASRNSKKGGWLQIYIQSKTPPLPPIGQRHPFSIFVFRFSVAEKDAYWEERLSQVRR